MKRTAVLPDKLPSLAVIKRLYLLFDDVLVRGNPSADITEGHISEHSDTADFIREYEYLLGAGILAEPSRKIDEYRRRFEEDDPHAKSLMMLYKEQYAKHWQPSWPDDDYDLEKSRILGGIIARYDAAVLRKYFGHQAVPIISPEQFGVLSDPAENTSRTITVAIKYLPLPDENTPWEALVDFKSDIANGLRLHDFQRFLCEFASDTLSGPDIDERIAATMISHLRALRRHRIEKVINTSEAIICLPAEAIENLLKLRLTKFAKQLFSFSHKLRALTDEEQRLPGSELSYVQRARAAFSAPYSIDGHIKNLLSQ